MRASGGETLISLVCCFLPAQVYICLTGSFHMCACLFVSLIWYFCFSCLYCIALLLRSVLSVALGDQHISYSRSISFKTRWLY